MLLIQALMKEEAGISHLQRDDSPLLPHPSPEAGEYEVPPGRGLNAKFHMVLKGGKFQTDTFSSVDINEWIALQFFLATGTENKWRGRKVSN